MSQIHSTLSENVKGKRLENERGFSYCVSLSFKDMFHIDPLSDPFID